MHEEGVVCPPVPVHCGAVRVVAVAVLLLRVYCLLLLLVVVRTGAAAGLDIESGALNRAGPTVSLVRRASSAAVSSGWEAVWGECTIVLECWRAWCKRRLCCILRAIRSSLRMQKRREQEQRQECLALNGFKDWLISYEHAYVPVSSSAPPSTHTQLARDLPSHLPASAPCTCGIQSFQPIALLPPQ